LLPSFAGPLILGVSVAVLGDWQVNEIELMPYWLVVGKDEDVVVVPPSRDGTLNVQEIFGVPGKTWKDPFCEVSWV